MKALSEAIVAGIVGLGAAAVLPATDPLSWTRSTWSGRSKR
jgi:hypothetical protein